MEKLKNVTVVLKNKMPVWAGVIKQKLLVAKTIIVLVHKKNKFVIPVTALVLVAIIAGIIYFSGGEDQKVVVDNKNKKIDVFAEIEKGELVGTFAVGETVRLGEMEITLQNVKRDSFRTLELDSDGNRINKNYVGANLKVFNTSNITTEYIFIGLEDDKGNQYEMDKGAGSYIDGIKDFGWATDSYPRTIREGYALFTSVDQIATNLKLIIFSNISKKKIIFEFER